jgi:hypothetical protein
MDLRLTDKEQQFRLALLHLLHQISRTGHYEFQAGLREQCKVLEGIMDKLKMLVPSAA